MNRLGKAPPCLVLALALVAGVALGQDKSRALKRADAPAEKLQVHSKSKKMQNCAKRADERKYLGRVREKFLSQCLKG